MINLKCQPYELAYFPADEKAPGKEMNTFFRSTNMEIKAACWSLTLSVVFFLKKKYGQKGQLYIEVFLAGKATKKLSNTFSRAARLD